MNRSYNNLTPPLPEAPLLPTIPEQIVQVGKLAFERRLSDIAGGNISARDGSQIHITPTGAGQSFLWQLDPQQILSAPIASDELMQHPQHSKESISHLMVYRAFPEVGAVIHAHPFHVMVFCAALKPIPPLTLSASLFGEIGFLPDAPLYSAEQGEHLLAYFGSSVQHRYLQRAAAVLLPRHGIFIAARNLYTALDTLERIDNSAYVNLAIKNL